jgi:hypothetical protein
MRLALHCIPQFMFTYISRQDAQPWYVETFLFHNCTGGTVCLSCQRVKRECRLY